LTLYIGPRLPGMANASPFCTKLEAWLRMAGVAHEVAPWNPFVAPKGKMPAVRVDGERMGDSQLIIEHLGRVQGVSLDAWLSPEQAATARLLRRALEEGTYFALVQARWDAPTGFEIVRTRYFEDMPAPVRWIFPHVARRGVRAALKQQGTGRHDPEVVRQMAAEDLRAASVILGDKPFLFGDRPCTADCVLFAFVSCMLVAPALPWADVDAEIPALRAYHDRIRDRWFPELTTR
jgi:glutathione S-transferase